jgi:cytochrome c oxidase subunit 2
MIVVVTLIIVALGSVLFHLVSPWWWTPIASNWGGIDDTIVLTFWITGVVYVAILLFMAYCVWKFRYREDRRADYEPENNRLEWILTILTSIGVAGMLAPGLIEWNKFVNVPEDATAIEVLGQQWQWSFRLPGEDGVLGTTDVTNINDDNPFGLNTNDGNGTDDVLIDGDDLHIPIGSPIKVELRSIDVLHDFYVPQFRAKMDLVPGTITYFWFTPTRTGEFEILCAELCGSGHHEMRSTVVVDSAEDYQTWLQEQTTFAQSMAAVDRGEKKNLKLTARENDTDIPVTRTQ